MKVKVCARCNGMNDPAEDIYEVPDDTSEDALEEMAREHGQQVTGYEHWFELIDKRKEVDCG